jgi:putative membrane protein
MIKNFGDHAANERRFLAWVRTAIAMMAFGFLIERFDVFLEIAAPSLAGRNVSVVGQKFANAAGLTFIVLGTVIIIIAATRFFLTARKIDSDDTHPGLGTQLDIALAVLLVLLVAVYFYICLTRLLRLSNKQLMMRRAGASKPAKADISPNGAFLTLTV